MLELDVKTVLHQLLAGAFGRVLVSGVLEDGPEISHAENDVRVGEGLLERGDVVVRAVDHLDAFARPGLARGQGRRAADASDAPVGELQVGVGYGGALRERISWCCAMESA